MSTVVLDTITGKSTATTITIGSTPVVSASANSMTIRGEGTAQTSIQQGLAKAWIHLKGADTFANVDSLNVSGVTDNGTGDYTITINNDMGSNTYSVTGLSKQDSGAAGQNMRIDDDGTQTNTMAAGLVRVNTTDAANSAFADSNIVCATIHGDLA
jgi:hypothetical protein